MIAKVFGWVMIVLNIFMVIYIMVTPMDYMVWSLAVFFAEVYISIKYVEGLK